MELIILTSIVSGLATGAFVVICLNIITVIKERRRKKEFKERLKTVLSLFQTNEKILKDVLLKTDVEKDDFNELVTELKKQDAINRLSLKKKN